MEHTRHAKGRAGVQGLTTDAAVAAEAEAAMAAGAQQMRDGHLSEALALFCAAADAVPLRSRLGGESTLQRAICLDSMVSGGVVPVATCELACLEVPDMCSPCAGLLSRGEGFVPVRGAAPRPGHCEEGSSDALWLQGVRRPAKRMVSLLVGRVSLRQRRRCLLCVSMASQASFLPRTSARAKCRRSAYACV